MNLTSAVILLVFALGAALYAAYELGTQTALDRYWVGPRPPVEPQSPPPSEPGEADLDIFLEENFTTQEIPAIDTAVVLAEKVLPELERQQKLTKRYRREKNNAERILNGPY